MLSVRNRWLGVATAAMPVLLGLSVFNGEPVSAGPSGSGTGNKDSWVQKAKITNSWTGANHDPNKSVDKPVPVISDETLWADAWSRYVGKSMDTPVPEIDFSSNIVVAVHYGTAGGSAAGIEVEGLYRRGPSLVIRCQLKDFREELDESSPNFWSNVYGFFRMPANTTSDPVNIIVEWKGSQVISLVIMEEEIMTAEEEGLPLLPPRTDKTIVPAQIEHLDGIERLLPKLPRFPGIIQENEDLQPIKLAYTWGASDTKTVAPVVTSKNDDAETGRNKNTARAYDRDVVEALNESASGVKVLNGQIEDSDPSAENFKQSQIVRYATGKKDDAAAVASKFSTEWAGILKSKDAAGTIGKVDFALYDVVAVIGEYRAVDVAKRDFVLHSVMKNDQRQVVRLDWTVHESPKEAKPSGSRPFAIVVIPKSALPLSIEYNISGKEFTERDLEAMKPEVRQRHLKSLEEQGLTLAEARNYPTWHQVAKFEE